MIGSIALIWSPVEPGLVLRFGGRVYQTATSDRLASERSRSTYVNIYVGNLPFSYDSQQLEDLFSEYGEVSSAQVILDRDTGRSRGFGFVELPDDAARKAIEELDGSDLDGRSLTVNEAKPRSDRGDRGGGRR